MEDQCRRMEDEMKFKMELCEQQLEEVRSRREVEITQLDGKLQVRQGWRRGRRGARLRSRGGRSVGGCLAVGRR